MPKLRELIQTPPEPEGGAEEQLEALRDYLRKVTQELEYLLTHLEADNINDTTFERISEMIPRPYTGLPLMDGEGSAGTSAAWSRGNHRHPHDDSKADVTALENHTADKTNPHEVTKAQVGLGNVANERQYSAQNPPPIPTPGQVGAVPVTREINGHAMSADVTLDHTDVGAIAATDKGSAGGVAELDANGHVPSSQLPSYVDDVKEYPSVTDFPIPGESDKIYIALDTDLFYRWGGTVYAPTNPSLALGETSSTAYRGDRGKTAYDHSQTTSGNPHNVSASDVGLGNVANERQYSVQNPPPLPTPSDIGAATAQDLSDHVGDTANPHGVTAAQVGARPDDWVPDAEDVPYDNTQSGLTATDVQAAIDEIAQGGGGGGPSPSDANPQMDGTAASGTALTYARGDHVHPTDTTRAAAALEINGHPLTGDFDLTAADVGAAQKSDVAVPQITGSTNTTGASITSGRYFYLNGVLAISTASIANGATFTKDTNYREVPTGGLNDLRTNLRTEMNNIPRPSQWLSYNLYYGNSIDLLRSTSERAWALISSCGPAGENGLWILCQYANAVRFLYEIAHDTNSGGTKLTIVTAISNGVRITNVHTSGFAGLRVMTFGGGFSFTEITP